MISKLFHPNDIYQLHFKLYSISGFWKIESTSQWKQILYKFYFIINAVAFLFLMFAEIVDAYLVKNNVEKLSTNLCSTIAITASTTRIWVLNFRKKKVDEIHLHFKNNFNLPDIGDSDDENIFEKYSKELTKVTIMFYGMAMPCSFFWMIFPMLEKSEEKRFPIAFPLIPKVKESPNFEIVYGYLVMILLICPNNVLSFDLIVYGFLTRVRAHFEILIKNFKKVKDLYPENNSDIDPEENEDYAKWRYEETMKIIKGNIIHHKAILKAIQDIDDTYRGPTMIIVASCTGLIGVVAYDILTTSGHFNLQFLQRLFYVDCALFDLFVYSFYGTQIEVLNEELKQTLYGLPWYDMEEPPKKLVHFVIAKLHKAPMITAARMLPITFRTFLELMKISFNVIAVLRELTSRND